MTELVTLANHTLGDTATSLAVYMVPVLLLAGWLILVARRARSQEDAEQSEGAAEAPEEDGSAALNSSGRSADD